jgi:hypothetical protein
LLGSDIVDGADDITLAADDFRIVDDFAFNEGQTQIEDLRMVVGGHHDIAGLHIAMDETLAMSVLEGRTDLSKQTSGSRRRQWATAHDQAVERRARNVF